MCVHPPVPRLQTAGFQTAGCNGVWRGKKKKKMQSHNTKASVPAFLHTDNTTAPDSIKDRTWLRSLTMFLWAVSVNRSGCVIFAKMPIDLFIIIKDTGNIVKTTCTKIPIQIYKD